MKCSLCPVMGQLFEGKSNLAKVNTAAGVRYVCAGCVRLCVSAWARKARLEAVPPTPPKPPTNGPTGDTAPALLAVAS